ncbi:MAG: hypothetical protein LBD02_01785 [Christensenellaceae bacterium]|jgi:hypothetical protein|nr:hypothetical protein [Christensenellaceae bacterium]
MMIKIACTEEEASCLIPNIIVETKTPCPCNGKHGLAIEGYTYDGREVKIQIQSGMLLIDGMAQGEVDAIRARRCPLWAQEPTGQAT